MTALPLATDVHAAATHGSYCPKMCTFACPVATATGLDPATPWNFHRAVADLGDGRGAIPADWSTLRLCNGCLACQTACTYQQDVPAQVIAGRTALVEAGHVPDDVARAVANLRAGLRADGTTPPPLPESSDEAILAVLVGVDEDEAILDSLLVNARQSGTEVRWIGGAARLGRQLAELGHAELSVMADARLVQELEGLSRVVVTEPDSLRHVADLLGDRVTVVDPARWLLDLLESNALTRTSAPALGQVTWHDPARRNRTGGDGTSARQTLRLLGGVIVEPEGHGAGTVAAGPGMGMQVLAPEATAAVAAQRARQLLATGHDVVTMGGAVIRALREAGVTVRHLSEVVAERTQAVRSAASPPPTVPDEP